MAAPNASSMPTTTQSNVSRPNVTRSASGQGKKTRPNGERPSRQGSEQQTGRTEENKQPSGSGYKGGSRPARENADGNVNSSRGANASSRPARNRAESDGNGSGKPERENTNKL